jgi:hypothetical protein
VADEHIKKEPTLVDRWLEEQQQWQRTLLTYLDSMAKNEDFLVHLGNAMRGSLLAGKAYPKPEPAGAQTAENPADERLDQILHRLNQIEGQLNDLRLTLDELQERGKKGGKDKSKKRKAED